MIKVVLQDGINDCGVCCLLSVIRYYGGDVSKEYLRELTNTTKNGVSAYGLIEGAKKIGFVATGMEGDLSNIEENNLPCLAHLVVNKNYKHFVVIYKIDKVSKKVILMDPAKGKKWISFSEFKLLSTKYFIFLKPQKKLPCFVKQHIIKKTIYKFLKENKLHMALLIILTSTYFLFNVIVSFHFRYLLEFAINVGVNNNIYLISFIILHIYFFKICSSFFRNLFLMKVMSFFDLTLTFKTFERILLLPYLYYKNRTTGEVITRLKDLTIIKKFLVNLFCSVSTDLISIFIFGWLLLRIDMKLSLISFFIIFLLYFIEIIRLNKKRKLYGKVCKLEDVTNSYLIEALSNVDTTKGSHIEKRLTDKFLLKYQKLLEKNYIYTFNEEFYQSIKILATDILLVFIYAGGSFLVIEESIKLSELFLFYTFFNYFLTANSNLLKLFSGYHEFKISLERIEDLYTIEAENFNGSYYYFGYDLIGEIEINKLSYNIGTKTLLKESSVKIVPGDRVLLFGASGSGKSTLVKMLMRYVEIPFGYIKINNIDINHYHLESLRNNITYVSSNEFLFTDTLYNNITLTKNVDEEFFFKILKICRINEILEDDFKGLQSMVLENGINFSNGERQRIILARALMRKSNIYIFDEALSQIDVSKEKDILCDIFSFMENKIIIVISHRLDNSELFNRVLKLKDGKLNEIEKI